jgi:hypothetical protein
MSTHQTFRVAKVVYFTDLTRKAARVIPLGSLAEVRLKDAHALALKARTALNSDEATLITPLLRDKLADPFAFWKVEFELAFSKVKKEGADALDFLAKRHASSLSVLAPSDYEERHWLLSRLFAPRDDAVEAKLSAAVDSEFADLLKRYGGQAAAPKKVIETAVLEAA